MTSSKPENPTIMVVDDDEVLGQVVARVLNREGRSIVRATTAAQALQLAESNALQLALLDLKLPDSDGVELAKNLHSRHPDTPLILMTAYPMRLRDHPEMAKDFTRILTKPLNLQELRHTVDSALGEESTPAPRPAPVSRPTAVSIPPSTAVRSHEKALSSVSGRSSRYQIGFVLLVLLAAMGLGWLTLGRGTPMPWAKEPESKFPEESKSTPTVTRDEKTPHTLIVPEATAQALGIQNARKEWIAIAPATLPKQGPALHLSGSTALDPTRMQRLRARFPAEVIQIGQTLDASATHQAGQTKLREWQTGDAVARGDVLLVFWSVEVGTKKSELVDALVQLKLDQEILDRSEAVAASLPPINLLTARRNVESDKNAIARAVNTLQTWGIPKEDIQAVYDEARQINERKVERDRKKEQDWARVEIKATESGVIVERNVNLHELVVDNTANLIVISQVERLLIQANAPEDELPELERLDASDRRWSVATLGMPPRTGKFTEISYLLDQNQHAVVLKGYLDNPGGRLRGGQFAAITINRPAPQGIVEIPITALIEDGRESLVFVQPDSGQPRFTRRRVDVAERFEKTAFIRYAWSPEEELFWHWMERMGVRPDDREPLYPGERVLTQGVLELKAALDDEESRLKK